MPAGLDIDYERELNGTMPPYTQHVVVRTGKYDWGRKIEDEDEHGVGGSGVNFARTLKGLVGRGGKFFDVCKYCKIYMSMFVGGSNDGRKRELMRARYSLIDRFS